MRGREERVSVSIDQSIRAKGRVESAHSSVDVSQATLRMTKYGSSEPWAFELIATEGSTHDPFGPVLRAYTRAPAFVGETDTGDPVRVPQLVWHRAEGDKLSGTAHEVWLGPDKLAGLPKKQFVVADLTPTTLAVPEKSLLFSRHTGEVTEEDGLTQRDSPRSIPSALGTLAFALHYRFESVTVGSSESALRIPTPTLRLVTSDSALDSSPVSLADAFVAELDPILRLVSFLSRRRVDWRRITVTSELPSPSIGAHGELATFERIRASVGDEAESDRERLVNPYRMGDQLFRVVNTLNASPYRESLLLSMLYIVSAQRAQFVETALTQTFTAWEAIVNGVSSAEKQDRIVSRSHFKSLCAELEAATETFVERNGLPSAVALDIRSKFGELNRRPFAARAAELTDRFKVPWTDLWSTGTDLIEGIRQIARRRNDFVHRADVGRPTLTSIDARRATVLVERLIYKILGCDDDWLDPFAYSFVRDLPYLEAAISSESTRDGD